MIDKDKQTIYYAMGRFVALFNLTAGEDSGTQLRRLSKIQDTSPKNELPFLLKTCLELHLEDKCPEILEVLDMINPDDIPERFTPETLGQFQIGYFHQESEYYKKKEENENK